MCTTYTKCRGNLCWTRDPGMSTKRRSRMGLGSIINRDGEGTGRNGRRGNIPVRGVTDTCTPVDLSTKCCPVDRSPSSPSPILATDFFRRPTDGATSAMPSSLERHRIRHVLDTSERLVTRSTNAIPTLKGSPPIGTNRSAVRSSQLTFLARHAEPLTPVRFWRTRCPWDVHSRRAPFRHSCAHFGGHWHAHSRGHRCAHTVAPLVRRLRAHPVGPLRIRALAPGGQVVAHPFRRKAQRAHVLESAYNPRRIQSPCAHRDTRRCGHRFSPHWRIVAHTAWAQPIFRVP